MINRFLILILTFFTIPVMVKGERSLDLSGIWNVELGDGINRPVSLPGTTDAASLGTPVDTLSLSRDEKFRRLTRRCSFIGPARYTRVVTIPAYMAGKPLELSLERVMWKSSLTIDGNEVGSPLFSLVAPHRYLIPDGLAAGEHKIELLIDNSRQYDISVNNLAHAYTNDTQVMWNGVLGDMTLKVVPEVNVRAVDVFTAPALDSVRFDITVESRKRVKKSPLKIDVDGHTVWSGKVRLNEGENHLSVTVPVNGMERWSEFSPVLHKVTVSGKGSKRTESFGIRTIDNLDGLRINHVPVFLRGTLECCVFPLAGCPPMTRDGWMKTFKTAREWGLNHLRFHSWCPPEAAFEVADSLGFYLQVELPVWSLKIGDDTSVEQFLRDEFDNIVSNYGNHPSLCMLSVGNELQHDFDWLNEMVAYMKSRDSRRLYTTTSFTFEKGHGGHPEPQDDFFVTQWTDNGWVRGQGVFESERPCFNKDYGSAMGCVNVPLVSHEIGQYAVYPSVKEIEKYTGTLNPLNFKIVRDDLVSKGMLDRADKMMEASCHLAAILYKEEIERAMKTSGMSGFQLLGLQDFPGQGTALVGLVDAFWDNKGAVSPEWFRQFCAPVVPLLNFEKATYLNTEKFEGTLDVSNFGGETLVNRVANWSVSDGQRVIDSGSIEIGNLPVGEITEAGRFAVALDKVVSPSRLKVLVSIDSVASNEWNIWVYPPVEPLGGTGNDAVVATRNLDEALSALSAGKNVLFAPSPQEIDGLESKFLPVFWSPVHFPKQAGTMGIQCDARHPALSLFPNDGYTDWQWWTLARNASVCNLDSIASVTPIVNVTDNFVNNRRLAYIFEARCGEGKLLFSSIDVLNPEIDAPERVAMKNSLLNYLAGSRFNPSGELPVERLKSLVSSTKKVESTTATSIYE